MDHQLPGYAELTPEIVGKVGEAAALLVVLSPAYLASTWCLKELAAFGDAIRRSGGRVGSRIFLVEFDQVDAQKISLTSRAIVSGPRIPWADRRDPGHPPGRGPRIGGISTSSTTSGTTWPNRSVA